MSSFQISRRALLAGLGGVAVALPALEILGERKAFAASAPLRYLVMFGGMSAGREGDAKPILQPGTYGANYALTQALQPLATRGVQNQVSIVSGLNIPRTTSQPGGMPTEWHTTSMGPLLSGVRWSNSVGNGGQSAAPSGTTSDQLVADSLAAGTPFRSLNYRVQASAYGSSELRGTMSWRKNGDMMQKQDPTVSASIAYQSLVGSVKPTDPAAQARIKAQMDREKSSVSLVTMKSAMVERLGKADRQRLEQHFDELRSLETRMSTLNSTSASCRLSNAAPVDSTAIQDRYAHEKERAPLLADTLKTAFSCDLTRVATLCVTHAQSFLGTRHLIPSGVSDACHQTSHAGDLVAAYREVMAWHVDVFAYMVNALKSTPDVDGRTLLDNTAIVYLFEGGVGNDPQEGGNRSAHSSENMVALVAGRAAGRAAGQHVNGKGKHPASVLLTAMKNVGVGANTLGEIGTTVPEFLL
jgi:hypothetical protein